jgi:hypothetical protein
MGWAGCASTSKVPPETEPYRRSMESGQRAYDRHRYASASAAFKAAASHADALLHREAGARARGWRAAALIRQGRADLALAALDAEQSLAEAGADDALPADLRRRLILLRVVALLETGAAQPAADVVDQLPPPTEADRRTALTIRGRAAAALEDRQSLISVIDELSVLEGGGRQPSAIERAAILGLEARLALLDGEARRAAELFDRQSRAMVGVGDHFAAALAMGRAGQAFAEAGESAEAAARLVRAGRALQSMEVDRSRWTPWIREGLEQAERADLPALAAAARRWLDE